MRIRNNRVAAVAIGTTVLVALGSAGGAVAAGMVGSIDIRNESIRSVDIKDGQVRLSDINDRAERQLRGRNGKDGVDGADGKDGAKGEPGVSNIEADGPYPGATNLTNGDNSTDKWLAGKPTELQSSWVMCAPGKVALGGGFSRADEGAAAFKGLQVVTSQPVQVVDGNPQAYTPIEGDADGSFVPNGWLVEGFNNGDTDLIVRPHVVCADVAE
jgi:hypothetical protein